MSIANKNFGLKLIVFTLIATVFATLLPSHMTFWAEDSDAHKIVLLSGNSDSAATYAITEKVAYGRDPSLGETLKVGFISGVTAGVTQYVGQELGLIQCFIAGTIVAAKDGPKKIEDIQVGDLVWATDPETGETELKEVKKLFRNETNEWIHITVNDEEIICTPNHPFRSCSLSPARKLQALVQPLTGTQNG